MALATLLASFGPLPATAESIADWQQDCVGRTYAINPDVSCNRPYAEGLAAVLTGKASDQAGTWGYIDKQGRMVITPAFQEAESFQNGLAAVQRDGLWGYIDARGNWVIKPRFTRASGFNAEGTALVEAEERDVLINRQGQVLKTFELGTRSWGFEPGQKLAAMEMPQPPQLFNTATGHALTLPADVMTLARPESGYLPAQQRSLRYGGWWGLLDANGRWAIAPDVLRSQQAPLRDGDTLAVYRRDEWEFVRPDGSPLTATRYETVQRVVPGLWLTNPGARRPCLAGRRPEAALHLHARLPERGGSRWLESARRHRRGGADKPGGQAPGGPGGFWRRQCQQRPGLASWPGAVRCVPARRGRADERGRCGDRG
ncbi:WG repeat-containing protein [Achromobacter xylosoxidans]